MFSRYLLIFLTTIVSFSVGVYFFQIKRQFSYNPYFPPLAVVYSSSLQKTNLFKFNRVILPAFSSYTKAFWFYVRLPSYIDLLSSQTIDGVLFGSCQHFIELKYHKLCVTVDEYGIYPYCITYPKFGDWAHLIVAYNNDNHTLYLYINGKLEIKETQACRLPSKSLAKLTYKKDIHQSHIYVSATWNIDEVLAYQFIPIERQLVHKEFIDI